MLRVAKIEKGKIVNLTVVDPELLGKRGLPKDMLDVTDLQPPADIGDEVVAGKIISKHAVKDLLTAKEKVSQFVKLQYNSHKNATINGFSLNRLSEIVSILTISSDGEVYYLLDDIGQPREFYKQDLVALGQQMYQFYKESTKNLSLHLNQIYIATTVTELAQQFPQALPLIHPEAQ